MRPENELFEVVPISISGAKEYVRKFHRHNAPPVGALFAIQVVDATKTTRGVVMVGRPCARALQDGRTAEITRLCTDGFDNACSILYGAARKAALAMGYTRLYTYTLQSESGASLRASGWVEDAKLKARPTWSCPSRPRIQDDSLRPPGPKIRWIYVKPNRS